MLSSLYTRTFNFRLTGLVSISYLVELSAQQRTSEDDNGAGFSRPMQFCKIAIWAQPIFYWFDSLTHEKGRNVAFLRRLSNTVVPNFAVFVAT